MMRLAIISSHPIQYNAPFFKELSLQKGISVKVFYTWSQAVGKIYDPGFGIVREWDIPLLDGYEYEFVKNIAFKPNSSHFWGIVNPSLVKKIKEWKPDFILVYGWAFYSHLTVIKHFYKKVPVLFRGDSTILDTQTGIKHHVKKILLKWIYSSVDIFLYVGKNNYNYFREYNVSKERLKYLPHVVENERFCEPAPDDDENELTSLKKKMKGKTVYLFVGKFEKKKNPLLLAEAFCRLSTGNAALLFVGQGELEDSLKKMTEGNTDIHFLPFQNQKRIKNIYHLADVLVLPSAYNETWGLVVNEAMAAGLAVIVSDKVGCWPDLVENGINGFIFPSQNLKDLVEIMESITPQNLNLMKVASRRMIDNFSIKKNALTMVNILSKK